MNLGRPKVPLQLEAEQREQLQAMAHSRLLPHGLVTRARIVLLSADGFSNQDIAVRMRRNPATVGHWRRRFVQYGLAGLHEARNRYGLIHSSFGNLHQAAGVPESVTMSSFCLVN